MTHQSETIPVPRAWLERLMELSKNIEKSKHYQYGLETVGTVILTGYISSAETLLTNGEKEEK